MAFDNATMRPPRIFKPHAQLIGGYWRVSPHPNARGFSVISELPQHITRRWEKAHEWAHWQNEAREFGMIVPGTK